MNKPAIPATESILSFCESLYTPFIPSEIFVRVEEEATEIKALAYLAYPTTTDKTMFVARIKAKPGIVEMYERIKAEQKAKEAQRIKDLPLKPSVIVASYDHDLNCTIIQ